MFLSYYVGIFLTGLLTGGLSCLAVQGGLLASTIAQRHDNLATDTKTSSSREALPLILFLGAKLAAYTIFGFLLGWFGSFFNLSLSVRVILQFLVVFFMLGTAFNLLELHPIFRYFIIQPPKFLARFIRKKSKSADFFAPLTLGAFTIFIPCGTTQAMMALAITSGNPLIGALILFSFVLGTSPVFFILGYLATRLGDNLRGNFYKLAAGAIIVLALFNLESALNLADSPFTFRKVVEEVSCTLDPACLPPTGQVFAATTENPVIKLESSGYNPNIITVKSGSKVNLQLVNTTGGGCIQAFTIPQLGIQKVVREGTSTNVEFTAPDKPQTLKFMCSMGMFIGKIQVI